MLRRPPSVPPTATSPAKTGSCAARVWPKVSPSPSPIRKVLPGSRPLISPSMAATNPTSSTPCTASGASGAFHSERPPTCVASGKTTT